VRAQVAGFVISALFRSFSPGEGPMRRRRPRSLRTSSPVHRRVFRPMLGWLEPRTLLSGNPTYYTVNLTSDTGASSGIDAITGDPSGDLLWAITQANNQGQPGYGPANPAGSVINFDPSVFATPQTITLTSTLELSESDGPEMIQGPGSGLLTISGGNAVGVFLVDGGVTASIAGVTISGGTASSGAGVDNNGTLTLSNSVISSNTASGSGGGLYNVGTTTVSGCTFAGDSTGGSGGGIYNDGTLVVYGSASAAIRPPAGAGAGCSTAARSRRPARASATTRSPSTPSAGACSTAGTGQSRIAHSPATRSASAVAVAGWSMVAHSPSAAAPSAATRPIPAGAWTTKLPSP
jgi:hypothetical protein